MCDSPPDPSCGTSYTFSDSDKIKILQHHNTIRHRAASGQETNTTSPLPPACEMCDLHIVVRIRAGILSIRTSIPIMILSANLLTYGIRERLNSLDQKTLSGGGFGHYSQIIWAKTCFIGCGLTSYVEGGWHRYYIACNYCVGGNYLDEPVYRIPCDHPNHCAHCCCIEIKNDE
ncbi:Venom allergen 5 [Armadillidium vulgare]|nr:Venom allergen 5 [Armadillidium vulgare]